MNCVSPGAIERGGVKREHMTFLGENGHSGTPHDIAEAVLFLASQDFITGQNIVVDGGALCVGRYDTALESDPRVMAAKAKSKRN